MRSSSASNHVGHVGAKTAEVPVREEMDAFDQFGPQMRRLFLLTPLLLSAAGNLKEIRAQEERNKAGVKQRFEGISDADAARMARIDLRDPRVDIQLAAGFTRWLADIMLKEGCSAHDVQLAMTPMFPSTTLGSTSVAAAREKRRMERAEVRLRLRPRKYRRTR